MGHLFISYAAEDSALARAIARDLEAADYRTWYYERDSYPGASYLSQILAALAEASAVLVILSPAALQSHQIDKELIQAHEADKPFVPVLYELTHAEVRERRREWAMMMGASVSVPVPREGVPALLPRLLEGLRRIVGPPTGVSWAPPRTAPGTATALSSAVPAPRDNLPAEVTSFVGRARGCAAVAALLQGARLVTVRGPGGVGKTRLALQVAATERPRYPDGVWLVELAPLADPAGVVEVVARAVGAHEEPGQSAQEALIAALRERRVLLVLDNCEHLVAACAALTAALLRFCPHLRILATSREGIGTAGEQLYDVPPLDVPDPTRLPPLEDLMEVEAVRLFTERARARKPDFALTPGNAPGIATICRRLDGIPLAIELAAARVGSMPVEGIAARLDDRFRLLTGGPRTALPRQQTLRAALDWSYDLLSEPERALLRRLSVCAGGCTLAAAEAVGAGADVEEWEVLDALDGLVNKSLVGTIETAGEARYTLLETVRQYGQERLAAEEEQSVRDRHLAWALALAEEAAPHLVGTGQRTQLERLEAERDNLRAALAWARERGDGVSALRLAGALWRYWSIRGYLSEGRGWLETMLALPADADDTRAIEARARALGGAGVLAERQGDYERAATLYTESLALYRALEDVDGMAQQISNLGAVAHRRGDLTGAARLFEESLIHRRERGDRWGIALSLSNLGALAWEQADLERATALYEESLALRRSLKDTWGIASTLQNLGLVARDRGDMARAMDLSAEGLALFREIGDQEGIANLLSNMATIALRQGDAARAAVLGRESLALAEALGDKALVAECLEGLAGVAGARSQLARVATLCGAAAALRTAIACPLPPVDRAAYTHLVQAADAGLGDAFTTLWIAGEALPLEETIAYAMTEDSGPGPVELPVDTPLHRQEAKICISDSLTAPAYDRASP